MVHSVFLLTSPTACSQSARKSMSSSQHADSPSLKRTYTLVSQSNPSSPSDWQDRSNPFKVPALSPSVKSRMSLSLKRRYPFPQSSPTTTTTIQSTQSPIPAFVSIFDPDVEMSGYPAVKGLSQIHEGSGKGTGVRTASPDTLSLGHSLPPPQSSVSTSASSSSNSSPTTTISTVASANTDERQTPDSSPDSPSPTMPLPSFKHSSRFAAQRDLDIVPPSPGLGGSRPLSPSKRPRNTKNLSLNVKSQADQQANSELQSGEGAENRTKEPTPRSMSAPSSPAFLMPPPPPQNPRRRPSALGLTIKLPGTLPDKTAVRGGVGGLRHHQSSPSLFSPALRGPPGGMTLPQSASVRQTTFNLQRPTFNSRWTSAECLSSSMSSSSISNSPPRTPEPPLPDTVEEEEEEVEPRSGEAKSPAYPEGPMLIFEPNIYLYAEPDAELASKFDVVINVAREVHNPFKSKPKKPEPEIAPETPIPDTAATDMSFRTAYEDAMFSPVESNPVFQPSMKEPEYIHMPWDHNTPILDDLPNLVETINERANEGKKILVHCQCGVSRSATLLIAYSMFKNPEKSMQDAYSAVKAKSKWIGPNMSLIYQLTDWKKKVSDAPRTAFTTWRNGPGTVGVRGLVKGATAGGREDQTSDDMQEPQTAPLPDRRNSPSVSPLLAPVRPASRDQPKPQMVRTRSENGGFISGVSPGPSSAPPGMVTIPKTSAAENRQSWPEGDAKFCSPMRQPSPPPSWISPPRKSAYAPPPPLRPADAYTVDREKVDMPGQFESYFERESSDLPPPTPAITSPRNSGYFGFSMRRPAPWGGFFQDPRSPNERGNETPVIRNIFDVL